MKRDITKFLLSLLIVAAGVWTVGQAVNTLCTHALRAMPDHGGDTNKINYVLNRLEADVVVLGSSRAAHHYRMDLLMDSLRHYSDEYQSCFNGGIDGYFTNCTFCEFESVIDRCKPKVIILEILPSDFYLHDNYDNSHIDGFAPHYGVNKTVKDYIDRLGFSERLCMKSNLYKFNGMPLRVIKSIISKQNEWDGYEPEYGTLQLDSLQVAESSEPAPSKTYKQSAYTVENFDRVANLAKEHGVNLIMAVSPNYRMNEFGMEVLTDLCQKHHVPLVNMSSTPYFNNHMELFKDRVHLNHAGATIYTSMLVHELKPYFLSER